MATEITCVEERVNEVFRSQQSVGGRATNALQTQTTFHPFKTLYRINQSINQSVVPTANPFIDSQMTVPGEGINRLCRKPVIMKMPPNNPAKWPKNEILGNITCFNTKY
jgi:hypothetical protein